MNVSCPECRSVFRVDPSKLPAALVRARCSVCGGLITVTPPTSLRDEFGAPPRGSSEPAGGVPRGFVATDMHLAGAGSQATASTAGMHSPGAPLPRPAAPFGAPAGVPASAPVTGSALNAGPAPVSPSGAVPPAPPPRPPARAEPPAAARPAGADASPPNLGSATAAALLGRVDVPPPAQPPSAPGVRGASVPPRAPSPARPAMPFVRPGGGGSPGAGTPPQPTGAFAPFGGRGTPPGGQNAPRRPINPFLANDPNAKARRLARALISDMVTYFPEKRDEALRAGTLKQVFGEEIKKSYEEYVGQVGREFAESTPHFQDALNEILAGGRKLF